MGADQGARKAILTGRIIGHYEVGQLIGAGGMGEVYRARDLELQRTVALKVVREEDVDAQLQLKREARHASQLNHPHICTIHEVGISEGRAYIVMEYVEGQPLGELIRDEGLPVETLLRYAGQLADALAHAHQQGVIHRDLKSANVAVTADGRAKVLDFGLARSLPAQALEEATRSEASVGEDRLIAGTLPYMAPELLRGEPADARSDIWALGVILYEMAAGRRPFAGATGFHLSGAILHEPPSPLPARIPASLQSIVRRSLAKDPRERYQSAAEVRSALEAVEAELTSGPLRAPVPPPARRGLGGWPAGALTAGVLMAALMFAWRWAHPDGVPVAIGASGRPAIAVMQFDNVTGAEETEWLSQGVPSMLLTGLAQTRGLDIVSAQRMHEAVEQLGRDSLDALEKSQVAEVARRAGAGAVVVGSIFQAGLEIRIDAQLEDLSSGRILTADSVRGTDVFAIVDQLASRIRDGIGVLDGAPVRGVAEVSSASLEAYRLYSQGVEAYHNVRLEEATRLLEAAVAVDPSFAQAYLQLALLADFRDLPGARRDNLRKVAEHAGRLTERERLLVAVEVARGDGNSREAARLLDELIARYPDVENAYVSAMRLYEPLGTLQNPEKYVETLATGVKALPLSTGVRNIYGYALLAAGRSTEAVREFETYARMAPREPNPYDSLGEAHLVMGAPEQAIEYYTRALTVDPTFTFSHVGRAWAWAMLGRYDQAIAEDVPVPFDKAFMLSRVGRYREAVDIIAVARRQAETDQNVANHGSAYLLSSLLALERRQHARALQDVRSAEEILARLPAEQQRMHLTIADLLAGMAEVRAGRLDAARARLASQSGRYHPAVSTEQWWHKALEAEIALAAGRLPEAAATFAEAEPPRRLWVGLGLGMTTAAIFGNNLPFADGPARVMKARGDLAGAIEVYRRLLSVGPGQKWMAMLEPRYVLELARLLEQTGQRDAARLEYRRFADLWKDADPGLPELDEARRAVQRLGG